MAPPASRVARVELFHVVIPLPATFRPAWIPGMPSNENRFTLVKVTTADACAAVGVAWIEEPLAMDGYEDLSALTEYSRVPIAGGEFHSSGLPELKTMIERRWKNPVRHTGLRPLQ